ncbi:MAG: P1 family peptidase [Pseudomonadota bacterium]
MSDPRAAAARSQPGPRNGLGDVAGLSVGHAEDRAAGTGATVALCAALTPAGVDVRGGGPATRETDALAPDRLVGALHAVVLTGGSVFGLAAADGVADWASARGVGFAPRPGLPAAPIVPAAAIYDLAAPGRRTKPGAEGARYRRLGAAAAEAARAAAQAGAAEGAGADPVGAVGAGLGARAGAGPGGLGAASLRLGADAGPAAGFTVAALVVANPVGAPGPAESGALWAAPYLLAGDVAAEAEAPAAGAAGAGPLPADSKLAQALADGRGHTTIGLVATDAALDAGACRRLAAMAHAGLARAVRPAFTPFDGDALFAAATGAAEAGGAAPSGDPMRLSVLGAAAADCVARAIARAVAAGRRAAET